METGSWFGGLPQTGLHPTLTLVSCSEKAKQGLPCDAVDGYHTGCRTQNPAIPIPCRRAADARMWYPGRTRVGLKYLAPSKIY